MNVARRRIEGDPEWVEDIIGLLDHPPQQAVMLPSEICAALVAWINDATHMSWQQNAGSLREELERSLSQLDRSLRRHVNDEVRELRRQASAGIAAQARPAQRKDLRKAIGRFVARLGEPVAVQAAWDDLIWALDHQNGQPAHVLSALAGLLAASQSMGADDEARRKKAREHMTGSNIELWISNPPADPPNFESRLSNARAAVSTSETREHCAVWLTFTHVMVPNDQPRMFWEHGPIAIYPIDWAIGNARDKAGQSFPHRGELESLLEWGDMFPPDESLDMLHQALVRVDLPDAFPSQAVKLAEEQLQIVRQIAIPRGALRWRPGKHTFVLKDDGMFLSGGRSGLTKPAGWVNVVQARLTSERFAEAAPAAIDTVTSGNFPHLLREALRIIADVGRYDDYLVAEGENTIVDERTVLVLEQQAVEHIAAWMRRDVKDVIDDVTEIWAANRAMTRAAETAQGLASRDRDGALLLQLGRNIGTIDFDLIVQRERQLLALCDGPFERSSAHAWFTALSSPRSFLRKHAEIQAELRLERWRHRRVRNSLAHGNPIRESELRSVGRFGRSLTNSLLGEALTSHGAGLSPADALLVSLAEARDRVSAAQRGVPIVPTDAQ